ncbi:MAG: hypothetical protein AB7U79_07240 [Candidatus Izemoplasmatales bacterium]
MSVYEVYKKRLKVGNIIFTIEGALTISFICLSFFYPSFAMIAFYFIVITIISQPILLFIILVANISTLKNNRSLLSPGDSERIVYKIINRNTKDFFQFVAKKNLQENTLYTMSRTTGFSNLLDYSFPMEGTIHVNFVYSKSYKDLKKDLNRNEYNIAMLDFVEDNIVDDLFSDGIDGVIFQKNSNMILICKVCQIEKSSPKLGIIYKMIASFYKQQFMIPLYGNIHFLYYFICQYKGYNRI